MILKKTCQSYTVLEYFALMVSLLVHYLFPAWLSRGDIISCESHQNRITLCIGSCSNCQSYTLLGHFAFMISPLVHYLFSAWLSVGDIISYGSPQNCVALCIGSCSTLVQIANLIRFWDFHTFDITPCSLFISSMTFIYLFVRISCLLDLFSRPRRVTDG